MDTTEEKIKAMILFAEKSGLSLSIISLEDDNLTVANTFDMSPDDVVEALFYALKSTAQDIELTTTQWGKQ